MKYEVTYRVTGKNIGAPALAHIMEKALPRKINEWMETLGFGCTVEILKREVADDE